MDTKLLVEFAYTYRNSKAIILPLLTLTKLIIPEDEEEMTWVIFDVLDPYPNLVLREYLLKGGIRYRLYACLKPKQSPQSSFVNVPPIDINFLGYPTQPIIQTIHTNDKKTVQLVSGESGLLREFASKLMTIVGVPRYYTRYSTEIPITIESKVVDGTRYQFHLVGARFSLERIEECE